MIGIALGLKATRKLFVGWDDASHPNMSGKSGKSGKCWVAKNTQLNAANRHC